MKEKDFFSSSLICSSYQLTGQKIRLCVFYFIMHCCSRPKSQLCMNSYLSVRHSVLRFRGLYILTQTCSPGMKHNIPVAIRIQRLALVQIMNCFICQRLNRIYTAPQQRMHLLTLLCTLLKVDSSYFSAGMSKSKFTGVSM